MRQASPTIAGAATGALGWKAVIFDSPLPDLSLIPERNAARADDLLALWRAWFDPKGGDGDGETDYENFFEEAAKLEAVIAECDPTSTYIATPRRQVARRVSDRAEAPVADLSHLGRYGAVGRMEWPPPSEHFAQRYHLYETFRRHAGRLVIPCGVGVEDESTTLTEAIGALKRHGLSRFVVKVMLSAKYGLHHFAVDPSTSLSDIEAQVDSALNWTLVHAEGTPASLLVQEWITMTHEYRLFIVDGRPVTGAACIEHFTPLDNTETFDPQMRVQRAASSPVVVDGDARDRLVAFGRTVAAELAFEQPELHHYVLDVALGADGQPLVVELNGLLNSGLYASDTRAVVRALMDSPHIEADGGPLNLEPMEG